MTLRLFSFVVFLVLQIAFLPLAVVGLVIVAYKQLAVSKRLGVSQTMVEVLNARWTMHVFDMREDVASARLADSIPNTSPFGLWLVLFPLWVKYKMSGAYFGYPKVPDEGRENLINFMVARTLYIDRIIRRVLGDMDQFVLLGAGYDTRAYGEFKRDGTAVFELDQTHNQELKVTSLGNAGIDAAHVTFVPVDFSRDDIFEKLQTAGYDTAKKTTFLWEGVTLYLAEEDVRKTLRDVREHAAPGSVVVADFYAERSIRMGSGSVVKKTLEYTDETLGFGLPFEADHEQTLQHFVNSEGLTVGETTFLGSSGKKGPFMVVAELRV
jgi:methyltransferase (TIGR00027 family)